MSSSSNRQHLNSQHLRMLDGVLRRAGFRKTVMSRQQESLKTAAVFLVGRFQEGISDPDTLLAELERQPGWPALREGKGGQP
ncbi:hypothetical protein QN219_21905 [Sinorhizobium sp. 7-81]|uniref:hypothetical protein n=1 Tax=Sinorhizobium sp. 8-89 TaxID=3049089 RepID=UPI0024C2B3EB|nr:hypothetical protein [Sinorhizobium sp. 8-89]MDK1492683.1 hypothetical protein [Sinorhizobium sp. 8-89]